MASEIVVQGETLEDALSLAAEQLGVAADDLDYEVLEGAAKGGRGLGTREVQISARIREDGPETGAAAADEAAGAPPIDTEDLIDTVLDAMDELLDAFDLDADSEGYVDPEGSVVVEVAGPDLGCLIGRRGQTLEAIQYLLSRIASRHAGTRIRVLADAEGYRARRKEALTELALRTAHRVAQSRRSIALRPMTPAERRVVHMALAEEQSVETWSEGEEPSRKVIVGPR